MPRPDAKSEIVRLHDLARDLIDHVLAGGSAVALKILPAGGGGLDNPSLEVNGGELQIEAVADRTHTTFAMTCSEVQREAESLDWADVQEAGEAPSVADAAEMLVAELARRRIWRRLDQLADDGMARAYAEDAAAFPA